MSDEADYLKEKLQGLSRRQAIFGGCILLLVLVFFGYFAVVRPVIVVLHGLPGISVKNTGRMDALICRVDGFWYWAGQVALLSNMPAVFQQVESGAAPVRLQVPDIPGPVGEIAQQGPWYMKLAVRYRIPGIPIFRYTTLSYFEFDPERQLWAPTENIPPKHRSLGKLGIGNVGKIELSFR